MSNHLRTRVLPSRAGWRSDGRVDHLTGPADRPASPPCGVGTQPWRIENCTTIWTPRGPSTSSGSMRCAPGETGRSRCAHPQAGHRPVPDAEAGERGRRPPAVRVAQRSGTAAVQEALKDPEGRLDSARFQAKYGFVPGGGTSKSPSALGLLMPVGSTIPEGSPVRSWRSSCPSHARWTSPAHPACRRPCRIPTSIGSLGGQGRTSRSRSDSGPPRRRPRVS